MTPPLFEAGALVWYVDRWSEYRRTSRIPGRVVEDFGYWCNVRLLLRTGESRLRRVRSASLVARRPEEPYS